MIKMNYLMPNEEAVETATRYHVSTTKVIEEDATVEMVKDTVKMLHDQNYDLEVTIKVKVPK